MVKDDQKNIISAETNLNCSLEASTERICQNKFSFCHCDIFLNNLINFSILL